MSISSMLSLFIASAPSSGDVSPFDILFPLIGGLGIFLLGMKNMSEGLQAVAGAGLRRLISRVTDNRIMATGVGTLVTCLVQSSSVTTVMVVGFVNSGLMTLKQSIGVIMGANIGTTITGWILVLKIGKYGLPILGIAAFIYLFSRRDRWRYTAMAIMGIGMVFFGLELMKSGVSIIKQFEVFNEAFAWFAADSYFGVLKCALAGCLLTVIVQSSSATLGITIALAVEGAIGFETAAALVMGENIGTTITAVLASIGATTNARRAAAAHVVFNVLGFLWITAIFQWYVGLIGQFTGITEAAASAAGASEEMTKTGIATVHSIFNILNTLIFLPFIPVFASVLMRVMPDRATKEKPHLTRLDIRMLETPVIGVEQGRIEVLRMGEGVSKMMGWIKEIGEQEDPDEALVNKVFNREEVLDSIQTEVMEFMTDLLAGNVPHSVIEEGRQQIRVADELESISDGLIVILKANLKLQKAGLSLGETQVERINELHQRVDDYLDLVIKAYEEQDESVLSKANSHGGGITHMVKDLRDEHLKVLTETRVDPLVSMQYTTILNAYRRIKDHALNVAEAVAGEK